MLGLMVVCPPHSSFLLGMEEGVFSLCVLDVLVDSLEFGDTVFGQGFLLFSGHHDSRQYNRS